MRKSVSLMSASRVFQARGPATETRSRVRRIQQSCPVRQNEAETLEEGSSFSVGRKGESCIPALSPSPKVERLSAVVNLTALHVTFYSDASCRRFLRQIQTLNTTSFAWQMCSINETCSPRIARHSNPIEFEFDVDELDRQSL